MDIYRQFTIHDDLWVLTHKRKNKRQTDKMYIYIYIYILLLLLLLRLFFVISRWISQQSLIAIYIYNHLDRNHIRVTDWSLGWFFSLLLFYYIYILSTIFLFSFYYLIGIRKQIFCVISFFSLAHTYLSHECLVSFLDYDWTVW